MNNLTRLLRTLLIALVAVTGSIVAVAQLDPASIAGTLNVGFNSSAEITVNLNAAGFLEPGQRIRLDYGTVTLKQVLNLKSVSAPPGINVTLKSSSLEVTDEGDVIAVNLNIVNSQYNTGNHPVSVVLRNTETEATTTLNLIVHAQ
jgi:hypothetical protein